MCRVSLSPSLEKKGLSPELTRRSAGLGSLPEGLGFCTRQRAFRRRSQQLHTYVCSSSGLSAVKSKTGEEECRTARGAERDASAAV